jgi:hypothetical protein
MLMGPRLERATERALDPAHDLDRTMLVLCSCFATARVALRGRKGMLYRRPDALLKLDA